MVHKMAKQKFYTKKYLKKKLSDLFYEREGRRPSNGDWWSDGYSFFDVFFDLEHAIFTDFELYPHRDGKDHLFLRFKMDTWFEVNNVDNDDWSSLDEFVDDLYDDSQAVINMLLKRKMRDK